MPRSAARRCQAPRSRPSPRPAENRAGVRSGGSRCLAPARTGAGEGFAIAAISRAAVPGTAVPPEPAAGGKSGGCSFGRVSVPGTGADPCGRRLRHCRDQPRGGAWHRGPAKARGRRKEIIEREPTLTVVAVAENGEQALQQLAATGPRIAILDVDMPKKDGFEVSAGTNALLKFALERQSELA